MTDDGPEQPSDAMRARASGGRVKLWLLLEANRWTVSAVLLAAVFLALVLLGRVDPSPLRSLMGSKDPVETLFQPVLASIITGVTLVVTINQLVLSQELGAVGDQRSRMDDALEYRDDVEDALDVEVTSPEPATFLRSIVDASAARATEFAAATGDVPDDLDDQIEEFVDGLTANADEVSGQLEDAQFGTFSVLSAALNYNYSWKLYQARRLRDVHADQLPEEAMEAVERLVETLTLFGPAREHFKTLYFQWELINLSRAMLYAAVPAIVITSAAILYVDAGAVSGVTLGVDRLVWLVAAMATVALAPFVLLLSYVLRIATVAKRTLAIGPFILRDTGRSEGTHDDE